MPRWLVVCLLLVPALTHAAGLPVVDLGAITQMLTQYRTQLQQYLENLKQTQQGIDQIRNQMEQIKYAYDTVQQGITNLQRLNLDFSGPIWQMGRQLTDKLSQAEYISYNAETAFGQAKRSYEQVSRVLSGQELRQMQQRWAGVQREAGQVGVAMEAIRQNQALLLQQNRELMARAVEAKGNLDIQQTQAQMLGVHGMQLLSIENQLATMGRMQAVESLEAATMKEATAAALAQAGATVTLQAEPAGKLLPLSK
jgi:chromosome segregation ATPase